VSNSYDTEVIDGVSIEHRDIVTNGVRLHCALAGPTDGPLVLALHGFPEYWRGMASTMVALAQSGFRVVAPDQRGYHLSEKPSTIDDYRIEELSADAAGLIQALGYESAHVVGHDWGAAVAWWLALTQPALINRLVIANVPHPSVMARNIRSNRQQMRKSWYIFAAQIPLLPELLVFGPLTRTRFAHLISRTANQGSLDEAYQRELAQAWSHPGAARGMFHWYRAAVRRRPERLADKRVHVPTLILWGRNDVALSADMVEPSAQLCDDARIVWFDDATHWVLHDEPAATAAEIVAFFSTESGSASSHS